MKNIKDFEKILNYKFKDPYLLKKSLIHKSFNNTDNNEKFEFLGDRVLGLIISKKLIEEYPNEKEGIIDKKFANLVNKKTCYNVANKLNLKKHMYIGSSHKSLERSTEKIISDCLEAIIGAMYLDNGFRVCEKFVLHVWKDYLDSASETLIDSKTKLQEYSLKKYKKLPKYTFHKKTGPQHSPIFKTDVQIPNSKKIIGSGTSKKRAQQDAAGKLLQTLKLL